jgi:hypothetical protein
VINLPVSYKRRPEDLPEGVAPTAGAIIEITAKSIRTLLHTISLQKLVPKIQEACPRLTGAIIPGKFPVSQGYIFAANLGSPDFFTIFDEIVEKPVTNTKLEKMLTAYKNN